MPATSWDRYAAAIERYRETFPEDAGRGFSIHTADDDVIDRCAAALREAVRRGEPLTAAEVDVLEPPCPPGCVI